jgi:hypothetical protein
MKVADGLLNELKPGRFAAHSPWRAWHVALSARQGASIISPLLPRKIRCPRVPANHGNRAFNFGNCGGRPRPSSSYSFKPCGGHCGRKGSAPTATVSPEELLASFSG